MAHPRIWRNLTPSRNNIELAVKKLVSYDLHIWMFVPTGSLSFWFPFKMSKKLFPVKEIREHPKQRASRKPTIQACVCKYAPIFEYAPYVLETSKYLGHCRSEGNPQGDHNRLKEEAQDPWPSIPTYQIQAQKRRGSPNVFFVDPMLRGPPMIEPSKRLIIQAMRPQAPGIGIRIRGAKDFGLRLVQKRHKRLGSH